MTQDFEVKRRELEIRLEHEGITLSRNYGQSLDGYEKVLAEAAVIRFKNGQVLQDVYAKIVASMQRERGITPTGHMGYPEGLTEGKGRQIHCVYCRIDTGLVLDPDLPGPLNAAHLSSHMSHRDPTIHLNPRTDWEYCYCTHGQHRFTEDPFCVLVNDGVRWLKQEVKEDGEPERSSIDDTGGNGEPGEPRELNGNGEATPDPPTKGPADTW